MCTLIKLTFVLIFTFIFSLSKAQTIDTIKSESYTNGAWENFGLGILTFDNACNNVSRQIQIWNIDSQLWIPYTLEIKKYDTHQNILEDIYQNWSVAENSWINYGRVTYNYNNNNYNTGFTNQIWITSSNTWQNTSRTIDSVDNNGNIIYSLSQQYYSGTGWNNLTRNSYTYNQNGKVETIFVEYWNGSDWGLSRKVISNYDETGIHQKQITYVWVSYSNEWSKSGKSEIDYLPGTDFTTSYLNQNYLGKWINSFRDSTTYNNNNTFNTDFRQIWTTKWNNLARGKAEYYSDGSLRSTNDQQWLNNQWTNTFRESFTHHGCILKLQNNNEDRSSNDQEDNFKLSLSKGNRSISIGSKNNNPNSFFLNEKMRNSQNTVISFNYLFTTSKPVVSQSIATKEINKDKSSTIFSIMPNPAKNYLLITLQQSSLEGQSTIKLSDLSGKLILTKQFSSTGVQKVDLPELPAGIYVLTLNSAKEIQSKLILIQ